MDGGSLEKCSVADLVRGSCSPDVRSSGIPAKITGASAGPCASSDHRSAERFFISNAGGESLDTVTDQTVFNGGPDRPYNEFYAAMKAWGRYQLEASPESADLVFQISWTLSDTGLKLPVLGQLRVLIIDPKTQVTLWSFTEYVRGAVLLGNRDKNFDSAMNAIVSRMKVQESVSPAPAQ